MTLVFIWLYNQKNTDPLYRSVVLFLTLVSMSFFTAFQYDVGTDYFSYINIYSSELSENFFSKGEFAFYYIIKCLHFFNVEPQYFIVTLTLLTNLFFLKFVDLLRSKGFNVFLIVLLYLTLVNTFHSQMNVMRAILSVTVSFCFLFYLFEKRFLKAFIIFAFMVSVHRSSILVVPIYILILFLYSNIIKYSTFYFFGSLIACVLGLPVKSVGVVVEYVVPFYYHYIDSDYADTNFGVAGLIVKSLTLPISFYFIFKLKDIIKKDELSGFDLKIISCWIILCPLYFNLIYFYPVARVLYFTVLFNFVPFYYLIQYHKRNGLVVLFFLFYAIAPYFVKVVFFPVSEYAYASFLFNH